MAHGGNMSVLHVCLIKLILNLVFFKYQISDGFPFCILACYTKCLWPSLDDIYKVACIFLPCATGGTNFKVNVSQQLTVGMFRKLSARVILTCRIQNYIQAFLNRNTFLVNRNEMISLSS